MKREVWIGIAASIIVCFAGWLSLTVIGYGTKIEKMGTMIDTKFPLVEKTIQEGKEDMDYIKKAIGMIDNKVSSTSPRVERMDEGYLTINNKLVAVETKFNSHFQTLTEMSQTLINLKNTITSLKTELGVALLGRL